MASSDLLNSDNSYNYRITEISVHSKLQHTLYDEFKLYQPEEEQQENAHSNSDSLMATTDKIDISKQILQKYGILKKCTRNQGLPNSKSLPLSHWL
jgi:hypothetical protein